MPIFYYFSNQWIVCLAYDAPARVCVPLFFMLTGYFLLNKPIDCISLFYIKRLHRIIFPFFLIIIVYYIQICCLQNKITTNEFIAKLLNGRIDGAFHLWYVFTLIGIYFLLPFFNYLFSSKNGIKLVIVYLIIWCIVSIIWPMLIKLKYVSIDIFESFNFSFFKGYIGYVLWGGVIAKIPFSKFYRNTGILFYIISSFLIFISTVIHSQRIGRPTTIFVEVLTPFILLQSISFFVSFKDVKFNNKFIVKFAELSYWIYLIHLLLCNEVYKFIPVTRYSIVTIPLMAVMVSLLGFVVALPLYKFEQIFNRFIFNPFTKIYKILIFTIFFCAEQFHIFIISL